MSSGLNIYRDGGGAEAENNQPVEPMSHCVTWYCMNCIVYFCPGIEGNSFGLSRTSSFSSTTTPSSTWLQSRKRKYGSLAQMNGPRKRTVLVWRVTATSSNGQMGSGLIFYGAKLWPTDCNNGHSNDNVDQ